MLKTITGARSAFLKIKANIRKVSLLLSIIMIITGFPISYLFAWSAPASIMITRVSMMTGFISSAGNSLPTGQYQIAGTGEISYCVDQEGFGPGSGTAYALNDGLLESVYRDGIVRIILRGYPNFTNGLTAIQAQYATAMAIHFWERYCYGGIQGYSPEGVSASLGYANSLTWSLQLLSYAKNQSNPALYVSFESTPTAWTSNGGVLQSAVQINGHDTDYWVLSMPEGVSIGGINTYTGAGNANITMNLTDPAAFFSSDKRVSVEGYAARGEGNIHYYMAGGYQTLAAVSREVDARGDPDSTVLADASTTMTIYKSTFRGEGNTRAEPGAVFQIYSSDYSSYTAAPAVSKDLVTTGSSGYAQVRPLPYGEYIIHQIYAPPGTWAAQDTSVNLSASNQASAVSITNEAASGRIEVFKKTDRSGLFAPEEGAVYQIFISSAGSYAAANSSERDQITTDEGGYAITKLLPYGMYSMVQASAPLGTVLDAEILTFNVGTNPAGIVINDDLDTANRSNSSTYGKLEISKTTNRGYSVPEAGAVFEVFLASAGSYMAALPEERDEITTSAEGTASTKDLPYGTYSVHQKVMPDGTKAAADFCVTLGSVNGEVIHRDLVNETYWGVIEIQKYKSADSDSSGELIPEADADFRIYLSSAASYEEANICEKDSLTTDSSGLDTSRPLPFGEYTVEQIDSIATQSTFKVDDWQVVIGAADNQTYTYIRSNKIYEQYLAIIKTDEKTGNAVKIAGATFQILAQDATTILSDKKGNSSFTTDANGRIKINDLSLQVGKYYIREIKAPMGYILNDDLKAFTVSISDHGSSIVSVDYGKDIRSVQFEDAAQTCRLVVEKFGEVITSAVKTAAVNADTGAQYTDMQGKKLTVYDFGYSLTGKTGAEFEVFVGNSDIADHDGMVKKFDKNGDGILETSLTSGTSLGTITTAAVFQPDGSVKCMASMDELPLDSITGTSEYVVKEVKAPIGDMIHSESLTYNFTYTDHTISQIQTEKFIIDTRQKVQITILKEKESGKWKKAEQAYEWTAVPAQGILFGLFTQEDIMQAQGSVIVPADSLVDVLYTGANGMGKTSQDLPFGNYYIKELNVTPDVVVDADTIYQIVTVPLEDQTISVASFAANLGKAIINRQIAGTMEIYKLAQDTRLPMEGIVFEVYDNDKNRVDVITTDSDGLAKTIVLPFGRYSLIETKSNTGYALAGKTTFSIFIEPAKGKKYSETQMAIANQKMAKIEVIKRTEDGKMTPMNGVIFGVYETSTNNEMERITTDSEGYGFVYALAGDYYLQEIKTWDGYALSKEKYPVITELGQVYSFRLTNMKTTVTLSKKDISNSKGLPGAQIVICDEEGKEVSRTTTDLFGETTINNLAAGSYTFRETIAPEGYTLNVKAIPFVIDLSGEVKGETTIFDEPTVLLIKKTSTTSSRGLEGMQFTVRNMTTGHLADAAWSEDLGAYISIQKSVLGVSKYQMECISPDILTTGPDGTAKILFLPVGRYIITETGAPAGYIIDSSPKEVFVNFDSSEARPANVTIQNEPLLARSGETGETGVSRNILAVSVCCLGIFFAVLFLLNNQKKGHKNDRAANNLDKKSSGKAFGLQ